jgi:transaldolase
MQIWLDTIHLETVTEATRLGVIAGITTNPSILAKAHNISETLLQLLERQNGPVAVQVTGQEVDEMVEEGKQIYEFSHRLIVKVPINQKGLIAIQQLKEQQIPVMGTTILHPTQALLAANLGVAYVAPYFSHMGDGAQEILKSLVTLVQNKTKVLVASLRSLDDLLACALIGVDAVTIKEDLFAQLVADHPLMDKFSQKFQADWRQGNHSIKSITK